MSGSLFPTQLPGENRALKVHLEEQLSKQHAACPELPETVAESSTVQSRCKAWFPMFAIYKDHVLCAIRVACVFPCHCDRVMFGTRSCGIVSLALRGAVGSAGFEESRYRRALLGKAVVWSLCDTSVRVRLVHHRNLKSPA